MRYEPASRNPTATGPQPGTVALARAIQAVYPELPTLNRTYGIFNRRRVAGSQTWSLHAEGRALDVGVPTGLMDLGWQLACELVVSRSLYGVQRVIWDRHIWSVEHLNEWRRLSPRTQQHLDHIHVEQYRDAAARPLASLDRYRARLATARQG